MYSSTQSIKLITHITALYTQKISLMFMADKLKQIILKRNSTNECSVQIYSL